MRTRFASLALWLWLSPVSQAGVLDSPHGASVPELGLGVYRLEYAERLRIPGLSTYDRLYSRAALTNPQQRIGIRHRLMGWVGHYAVETGLGGASRVEEWQVEGIGVVQRDRLAVADMAVTIAAQAPQGQFQDWQIQTVVRHRRFQRSQFEAGPGFAAFDTVLQNAGYAGFALPTGTVTEQVFDVMAGVGYARTGSLSGLPAAPQWRIRLGVRLPVYVQLTNSSQPGTALRASLGSGYAVDMEGRLRWALGQRFALAFTAYAARRVSQEQRADGLLLPHNTTTRTGLLLGLHWHY